MDKYYMILTLLNLALEYIPQENANLPTLRIIKMSYNLLDHKFFFEHYA